VSKTNGYARTGGDRAKNKVFVYSYADGSELVMGVVFVDAESSKQPEQDSEWLQARGERRLCCWPSPITAMGALL
jgi:hypothetical protein